MTDGWMPIADAVRSVSAAAAESPENSRLMLCEWLGDGMLTARVDRLISRRLRDSDGAPREVTEAESAAVMLAARPLLVSEWPTEPVVEEAVELPRSFWKPIPPGIETHDFWTTGRLTTDDGSATCSRRQYVGLKIERSRLAEVAEIFGLTQGESSEEHAHEPTAQVTSAGSAVQRIGPGRRRGSENYTNDTKVVQQAVALCDAEGLTVRHALLRLITIIEPKSLDDESKIRRLRPKVIKFRSDLR